MLPSDTWKTAVELSNEPAHTHWQRLRFDAIERVASACRDGVACRANRSKYAAGHHNIAIELLFDDGTVWIARLTTHPDPLYNIDSAMIADFIKIEVATLRLVSEMTDIPVAKIFAYSETRDNPIGWPYVLMSALEGYHLQDIGLIATPSEAKRPVPEEKVALFETFCASLAEVIVQLGWITFDTTGSIWLNDKGEYAVREDAERHASSAGYWGWRQAVYRRRADLEAHPEREFGHWLSNMAVRKHMEHESGQFSLVHRALEANNLLVDKTGAITGIFGWTTAACLPRDFRIIQMPFVALNTLEIRDPWREMAAETFNSALEVVAPELAQRHRSKDIQLLSRVDKCPLSGYASPDFWQRMCMGLWKRANWERVREERAVLEWLFGGGKPGETKRDEAGKRSRGMGCYWFPGVNITHYNPRVCR